MVDQIGLDHRLATSSPSRCWVETTRARSRPAAGRARRLVPDRDLRLSVRPEVGERLGLAHLGQALGELVGEHDRERHQLRGLVARVAEHQPLVAGPDVVERIVVAGVVLNLERVVDALGDVGRLLVERHDHRAGLGVEAVLRPRCSRSRRSARGRAAECRHSVEVVISPATTTRPVVTSVSQATRPSGSSVRTASRTESEI